LSVNVLFHQKTITITPVSKETQRTINP